MGDLHDSLACVVDHCHRRRNDDNHYKYYQHYGVQN